MVSLLSFFLYFFFIFFFIFLKTELQLPTLNDLPYVFVKTDQPPPDIISSEINIIGNLVGSYNDLAELMVLAAQGKVKLHTQQYKLDDFQKAIDDLSAGKVRGRAILVP